MFGGGLPIPEDSFINYSAKAYARSHIWALNLTSFVTIIDKNNATSIDFTEGSN
jgi:hypothetical protein